MKKERRISTYISTFFRALYTILQVDKKVFFILILLTFLSGLSPILAIKASVDLLHYILEHSNHLISYFLWEKLAWWGGFLFLHNLTSPMIAYLQSNLSDKSVFVINEKMIAKANRIEGLQHFEDQRFHDDLQMILSQAHYKPINFVVTMIGFIRDFTVVLAGILLLYYAIGWLALIPISSVLLHAKVTTVLQEKMWKESLGRSHRSRMMKYISSLSMSSKFAKEIRLFPVGGYLYKMYHALFGETYQEMLRFRKRQMVWPIVVSIFSLGANIGVLWLLVLRISNHSLQVSTIALLLQTVAELQQQTTSVGQQAGWIAGHLLFFEKYFSFLSKDEAVYHLPRRQLPLSLRRPEGISIVFDAVSFAYPNGEKVLDKVSFEIKPKETVAIVGHNGAGKTSLVKLLCGFYTPTEGEIRINHIPIGSISPVELRRLIAPVFQDFCSYDLSIMQNIVMGGSPINYRKLERVMKEAQLPFEGSELDHLVGKEFGGKELSGGEWQKVAIARAIYKDAYIFILDEPSSSLDPISEAALFEEFRKITKNKTTLFVTHRLNSIKMVDKVLLLDKGKKVALGHHKELLDLSELYRTMFYAQAKNYNI